MSKILYYLKSLVTGTVVATLAIFALAILNKIVSARALLPIVMIALVIVLLTLLGQIVLMMVFDDFGPED
jgi:hypothetical protein